ncbi:MAG: hypothetical protein IRY95_04590, partial [Clostridia bacterium]|nr:hypothetical protein [Clostridia bacterium]
MTAEPDARRGGRDGADLRDRLRELVRRAEAGDLAAAEIPATALAEELAASWRGGLTLDAAAEGLLLAAHLLAHKADALVPRREEPVTPSAEPLPEEALAEPEPAVLERLAALEPFREAAAALREYEAARAARYARGRPQLPEASDAGGATAEQLLQALARIWARAAAAAPLVARRAAV